MKTKSKPGNNNTNEIYPFEEVNFESSGITLNALIKNKSFGNSKTVILKPRGKAKCNACIHLFEFKNFLSDCPKCKSHNTIIISGKELTVKIFLLE